MCETANSGFRRRFNVDQLLSSTESEERIDKISDTGVEERVKENVRATQGKDAKDELLDWGGKSWLPPPIEWEDDRPGFDNGFMDRYVREDWEPMVPRGPSVAIDTKDPKFELAVPVGTHGFDAPIDHPLTIPGKYISQPYFPLVISCCTIKF